MEQADPARRDGAQSRDVSCFVEGLDGIERPPWGADPSPWMPGRGERATQVDGIADGSAGDGGAVWCVSGVDIFADLSEEEMAAIAAAAPRRSYAAGQLLYSPRQPVEALFILKSGRVRIFRVSPDGRALTTAIITPGTIFGEMILLGQRMHDNFAEALEETVACVMSRPDVARFLLSDPRIAARITEMLGQRLVEMERRLADSIFKSVPQRVAGTLCTLADQQRRYGVGPRSTVVTLTHEQIAALVGTSRETVTKALNDLADQGLLHLGRGRITLLDLPGLSARGQQPE